MTTVAAKKVDDDTWLLAADSLVTDDDAVRYVEKIYTRADPLVAFSFQGDGRAGLPFKRWFLAHEWRGANGFNWETFTNVCGTELARINGDCRNRARLAEATDAEDEMSYWAEVMMVGTIGGELDAWIIDRAGGCTSLAETDPIVKCGIFGMGAGGNLAVASHRTLLEWGITKLESPERTLGYAVEAAATIDKMSNFPISMYRITRDEIGKVLRRSGDWGGYETIINM